MDDGNASATRMPLNANAFVLFLELLWSHADEPVLADSIPNPQSSIPNRQSCFHIGWRFSRNAASPSCASASFINSSR